VTNSHKNGMDNPQGPHSLTSGLLTHSGSIPPFSASCSVRDFGFLVSLSACRSGVSVPVRPMFGIYPQCPRCLGERRFLLAGVPQLCADCAGEVVQQVREREAQANRERYPEIAAFVDDLRRVFGDGVRVLSVEEARQ